MAYRTATTRWLRTLFGGKSVDMKCICLQRGYRCALILLFLLCLCPPFATSAETLIISAQQQFSFAQHLFDSGQFQNAATEFDRFAIFFKDDPRRRKALFNAGHALLKAGDITNALKRFNRLSAREPLDEVATDAYFMSAECHLQMNNSGQALIQLRNLTMVSNDRHIIDKAYLRMGWIQIQRMDWLGAERFFAHISANGRQRHNIDRIEQELHMVEHLPYKNPTLAGTLSILPGAGQLYCERYEDALAAFLVNSGLAWAAVESFDNDLNGLGSMITLVGLGFYMGNIYGAVSSAHKYNLNKKHGFIENLKQHLVVGFSVTPGDTYGETGEGLCSGGLTLSFNYQF